MKKLLFAGLAAALCLVGCNKESDVKGLDGRPVEIILSDAATRTVNNGMGTQWENGDALNVFVAPAGSVEYSANAKFEVDDAANNHAKGTAELTADAYDWYLLYPYSSYIKTPANTGSGYIPVGSKSNEKQTQAGLNSMAHLSGENLPVYGVAKNVARDETPVVSMKHVASVVAINLTNATSTALKVDEVSFTASQDIVGTYYIDFSQETLAFKGSGDNYVSNTASLTVSGDETIAAGASAKFYLAIKPFTAKGQDKLVVKVHSGELVFEKEVTLPTAVEFKSGVIKQLNVTYTGGSETQSSTLAEIADMDNGADVQTNEVLVVAKYARGIMLAENGSYLLAFNNNGVTGEIGDIVAVSGKVGEYAGLKQIASPEVTVISSDNEVVLPEPKVLETLDEYASDKVELIQYTGTLAVSDDKYFNVNVAGSTRKGSIQYPIDTEALKALDKKPITATGFFTGITGSGSYVNMMSTSVEAVAGNVFEVTPQQINVAATATSAEINVTGNVDWTAEPSEGATVDKTSGSGDGVITVSFPANTDPENTKNYTVFVRTEATGVNDEFEVNITQAKAVDAIGSNFVKVSSASELTDGLYLIVNEAASVAMKDAADEVEGRIAVTISGNAIVATDEVKAVAFTFTATDGAFRGANGKYLAHSGTRNSVNPTDTPSSNTVTFDNGNAVITASDNYFIQYNKSSGQERFRYYKSAQGDGAVQLFKLSGDAPVVTATLESIAVSGQTTSFTVGDTFIFDGKVTATYSDGSTKEVQPTDVSKPEMSVAGSQKVTVTYTEGAVTKTASYVIDIIEPVAGGKTVAMTMAEYVEANNCTVSAGTTATMYKTLQLNESVRMSTTGDDNCGSFWAAGDDKQWRLYQNKNGNVIISVAEGCELKTVKLTYVVTNTGVLVDAANNQVASDAVQTVSGSSVTYTVGNTGTATNGQVRITAVEVVYTGEGTTFPTEPDPQPTETTTTISMVGSQAVYVGESFELNATSNVEGAVITYESEDPSIATVSAAGVVTGVAEGTVKVYARIAAVEGQYTAAERYCNVTVSTKPVETDGTEVFIFSELGYANQADVTSVNGDNVTLVFDKGTGSNAPKYYDNGTNVRMYKNNTLTVSSDKTITKIEFFCTNDYGVHDEATFSTGTCVDNVWTGSAKSVEMVNATSGNTQIRFTGIKVTYE